MNGFTNCCVKTKLNYIVVTEDSEAVARTVESCALVITDATVYGIRCLC